MLSLDHLKPFIDWMQANPGLSAFAVFIISCAESLAIVGLFIPGSIVMPAIGSMIGAGVLPAHWIILAAILGAVVGDNLSYWLGYHFHKSLTKFWPFNRFPKLIENGEIFFKKYGGLSVFIGRFVGPVRPVIPVIAGMLAMKPTRFFIANLTSAIAWALVYMAPGILLGAISEQLAPNVAARLLVILALITLGIWILIWIANKLWNYSYKFIERMSGRLWKSFSARWPLTQRFVQHHHLGNHKPLSIVLYILFFIIFLSSITDSVARHGFITYLDWPVFLFLRSIQIPPLDILMAYLFNLSNPITLVSVGISVSAWLFFQKSWRAAYYCLLNIVLALALSQILQWCMPMAAPIVHNNRAFPSVLLTIFSAILGNFLMLSYYHRIWLRYKKYLLLLMLLLFACATIPKIYFGFNWLSGCIASLGCAAIPTWCCILFFHRLHTKEDLKSILFIAAITALIAVAATSAKNTDNFLAQQDQEQFSQDFNAQQWWTENSLPVQSYRTNFLGLATEPLTIQYAGKLKTLTNQLERKGWHVAPKADLVVILNRIGAKNRAEQLPLLPDLYLAEKPTLIMTKMMDSPPRMLTLRLWSSQLLLQPDNTQLWVGTVKFHQTWHWRRADQSSIDIALPNLLLVQNDIKKFPSKFIQLDTPSCIPFCQESVLKIISPQMKFTENNDDD